MQVCQNHPGGARPRGVPAPRNSDKTIKYGEAYEAVFPHVVETLVPTEGR